VTPIQQLVRVTFVQCTCYQQDDIIDHIRISSSHIYEREKGQETRERGKKRWVS
jgi:hypothetical protein